MAKQPADIQEQLRRAIVEGELSRYRIAKLTGVSEAALSLFVNGHHSLTMGNAAKVAKVLGLELRPVKGKRQGR